MFLEELLENELVGIRRAMTLAIHKSFEAEGIEFAYPPQTVFMARDAAATN
jgi:small-conductance mechanosensitive channel